MLIRPVISKCLNEEFSVVEGQGTIVLEDSSGKSIVFNEKRAALPLSPASTFKIPNTLIALSDGVTNLDEVFIWDGKHHKFETHNQNQTLSSAYKNSCLWVYQMLAERIGKRSYLEHLRKMNYGNQILGTDLQRFWINGELKISALQQIELLKNIYHSRLPYDAILLNTLKNIMLEEETQTYRLYSKTGYYAHNKNCHGWYVGWLETVENLWFFALNIQIYGIEDLTKRKEITMNILKRITTF